MSVLLSSRANDYSLESTTRGNPSIISSLETSDSNESSSSLDILVESSCNTYDSNLPEMGNLMNLHHSNDSSASMLIDSSSELSTESLNSSTCNGSGDVFIPDSLSHLLNQANMCSNSSTESLYLNETSLSLLRELYSRKRGRPSLNENSVDRTLLKATRKLSHVASEKRRREQINEGFNELKNVLGVSDSKANILKKAIECIEKLKIDLEKYKHFYQLQNQCQEHNLDNPIMEHHHLNTRKNIIHIKNIKESIRDSVLKD